MFANLKRKAEEDAGGQQAAKMASGADGERRATFARNLEALNSQFAAWVAEQSRNSPSELWTDGMEDYLKYAKQLLADFKDVLEDGTAAGTGSSKPQAAAAPAAPTAAPAGGLFGFAGAAPAAAPAASKPPLAPGLFGVGSGSGAAPPASIFAPLPSTGGAFGLGASAPAFGGSGVASATNSGAGGSLFNVPSTGTLGSFSTAAAAGAEGEEDGEGEEEQNAEPSVQVEAGEGTEMLLKQRAKLMSMSEDKKWKDKGKGTLTLRRVTGEAGAGRRPFFVFTTDSGRVLLNAPLVKNLKPMMNPKAPASVIMILISKVDDKEERGMHMFRCESPEVAKQVMETVTEYA